MILFWLRLNQMCKHFNRFEKETLHQVLHVFTYHARKRHSCWKNLHSCQKFYTNVGQSHKTGDHDQRCCPTKTVSFLYFSEALPACACRLDLSFASSGLRSVFTFASLYICMIAWMPDITESGWRSDTWPIRNSACFEFLQLRRRQAWDLLTYPHRGSLVSKLNYKVSYSTFCPSSCLWHRLSTKV